MKHETDRDYYRRRRDEELRRAVEQSDAGLRALHERWARLYQQRLATGIAGARSAGAITARLAPGPISRTPAVRP